MLYSCAHMVTVGSQNKFFIAQYCINYLILIYILLKFLQQSTLWLITEMAPKSEMRSNNDIQI